MHESDYNTNRDRGQYSSFMTMIVTKTMNSGQTLIRTVTVIEVTVAVLGLDADNVSRFDIYVDKLWKGSSRSSGFALKALKCSKPSIAVYVVAVGHNGSKLSLQESASVQYSFKHRSSGAPVRPSNNDDFTAPQLS